MNFFVSLRRGVKIFIHYKHKVLEFVELSILGSKGVFRFFQFFGLLLDQIRHPNVRFT